jgi:hypothetical protein
MQCVSEQCAQEIRVFDSRKTELKEGCRKVQSERHCAARQIQLGRTTLEGLDGEEM